MSWGLDPEVGMALASLHEHMAGAVPPAVGDVQTRREQGGAVMNAIMSALPATDAVEVSFHVCMAEDGVEIPLRHYAAPGTAGGALVLYVHGGGMITGSVEMFDPQLRRLASDSGVAILAVDYRVAPEHPHPTPVYDCYAALQWAADHAAELGHDPSRLAVAGDSSGGGLAAATALLARDRGGPDLAFQVLIYPMLDDRNITAPAAVPLVLLWTHEDNATGWGALLGHAAGGDGVSAYAAPARADDLSGLPPTYISVGDIDIFCNEDVQYAARLSAAGVPVELHVHRGAPHGFDVAAASSAVARRAYADEVRVLRGI